MVSKPMTVRAALVALLAEGVDRNSPFAALRGYDEQVALLTEGVDRNDRMERDLRPHPKSPSSRRAWIEILNDAARRDDLSGRPPRGGRG